MKRSALTVAALMCLLGLAACGGSNIGPDAVTGTSGPALGGTPGVRHTFDTTGGSTTGTANRTDATFVTFAAQANEEEIELGRLAESHADLPEVKAFGMQMVQDHTAALQGLRQAATNANSSVTGSSPSGAVTLSVPAAVTLDAAGQQRRSELSALSGSAFDQVYMQIMVESHSVNLTRFQQQSTAGGGSSFIRDYAAGIIPTLQAHLEVARDVASRVGYPVLVTGESCASRPGTGSSSCYGF